MVIHQLILRRADQRILRVVNHVCELLRCAGLTVRAVHQVHPHPRVFLYLRLPRPYPDLRPEAYTSQEAAWQQGFFSDGLRNVMRDSLTIFSGFTNVYPTLM
jgi:hypothetical protein